MHSPHFLFSNYVFPFQTPITPQGHNPLHIMDPLNHSYLELQKKYSSLLAEHQTLLQKYHELQQKVMIKKRSKRRADDQLEHCHNCPYPHCMKVYASDFALNLHIRNKHQGGNKRQRDRAAILILKCQSAGLKPPVQEIQLPPGYLEQNRVRLTLMDSSEEPSAEVKSEYP